MSQPHLHRNDQIRLIRATVANIRAQSDILEKLSKSFDGPVQSHVIDLISGIDSGIHDSCLEMLHTDDELDEIARDMRGDGFPDDRAQHTLSSAQLGGASC